VLVRVRAHACVFMRGCVCACVVGPTRARVHACLCSRARMRHVHVHAHSRADVCAHMCMCHMMEYTCIRMCACTDK